MDMNPIDWRDYERNWSAYAHVRMFVREQLVDGASLKAVARALGCGPDRVRGFIRSDYRRLNLARYDVKSPIQQAMEEAWVDRGELLDGVRWPSEIVTDFYRFDGINDVLLLVPSEVWIGATILMLALERLDGQFHCPMTIEETWCFLNPEDAMMAVQRWQASGRLPSSYWFDKRDWSGLRRPVIFRRSGSWW